ncbi:MAG: hypothetical protein MJE77_44835 [Proteobacteria bacterium]|nr:hypothetical protein [Pseudomonadota bacterium]
MTAPNVPETHGFSVVLLGAMNPALHHPTWYKAVGVLDDAQEREALAAEFVFLPQLAQFHTADLQFFCDPQRWQLATANIGNVDKVVSITEVSFDEKLTETPLRAYGLNFNFHEETKCSSVGVALSKMVASLPLGFSPTAETSAQLAFTEPVDGGRLRCNVEPSVHGPNFVFVGFNAHYELGTAAEPQQISMKALLQKRLGDIQDKIDYQVKATIEGLNAEGTD